jgi:hypothetical protein
MRAFGYNGYLLRNARVEVRVVYTAFLVLVAIGLLTLAAFQIERVGPTPSRVAAYYRGGERGAEMAFAKSFRELVEVTHFHSFIMGVVFLVLAHLFIATPMGSGLKMAGILVAFAGLAGNLVSPWLVRYGSPAFAYAQLLSWAAEWVGFGAFVLVPIREMWCSHADDEYPPE